MVTRHGNPSRHGNTCGKLSIVIVTLRVPGRGRRGPWEEDRKSLDHVRHHSTRDFARAANLGDGRRDGTSRNTEGGKRGIWKRIKGRGSEKVNGAQQPKRRSILRIFPFLGLVTNYSSGPKGTKVFIKNAFCSPLRAR